MKKNTFILWSGGLDSTFMIQYLLDKDPNRFITAGYVEIWNNTHKTTMEKLAISKMKPHFQKKYGERFKYLDVVYRADVINVGKWAPLVQAPVWLSAIMSATPEDIQEVCIGYVMNDCAISYLSEFQKILKAYSKFSYGKFPKLSFPLSKMPKHDIARDIDIELKEQVVWCEHPVISYSINTKEPTGSEPCGHCVSCQHSPLLKHRNMDDVKDHPTRKKKEFVETINPIKSKQLELIWDEETVMDLEDDEKMDGMLEQVIGINAKLDFPI